MARGVYFYAPLIAARAHNFALFCTLFMLAVTPANSECGWEEWGRARGDK